jgi:tetratricopeptide (TPR) repeat protein
MIRKGNAYIKKGDPKKAEAVYDKLPNRKQLAFNKGILYTAMNDKDKANNYYQLVLQDPKANKREKAQVYYNQGNQQFRQTEFKEAIKLYRQGLLLYPRNKKIKYNLELANNAKIVQQQQQGGGKSQQDKKDQKQDKQDKQQGQPQDKKQEQSQRKSQQQQNAEKTLDAFKQQEQNDLRQSMPKNNGERKVEKDW